MRTKIYFKTKLSRLITETVDGSFTLDEARVKFGGPLYDIVKIETIQGTLSNERACQIIANEGIGYAVQSYIDGNEFSDPETAKLWEQADIALDNLLEHLSFSDWEASNDY